MYDGRLILHFKIPSLKSCYLYSKLVSMKPASRILTESVIDNSFSVKRLDDDVPYSGHFVRLNYHHIVIIERGRGVLTVDHHSFDIAGQGIFLLSKGQI